MSTGAMNTSLTGEKVQSLDGNEDVNSDAASPLFPLRRNK